MGRSLLILAAGLCFMAACTDAPVAPSARRLATGATQPQPVWADLVEGETGPGSLYGLYKPANWNGEAVFYAHGFVDAAAPVALPSAQDNFNLVRDELGTLGYAVAYSSFSSNGYDFPDGLRRMHQLRGLFASHFGVPTRSYLAGHSLGAEIALALAERHASQYDGALLMCGIVGGATAHFNWLGSVRLLFDYFYPGVLPGSALYMPPGVDLTNDVLNPAQTAIAGNFPPVLFIAAIDQTPLAGTSFAELAQSLVRAVAWHARGINDVTDRAHGHVPFDNTAGYTDAQAPLGVPSAVLTAVNAAVPQYTSPPDVQAWLDHNYQPSGQLSFPVLTLHTTQDPSVPFFHENLFASLVGGAGTGNFLVQRSINRYGHCAFTVAEMVTAFTDLVNWVENGVTPTP